MPRETASPSGKTNKRGRKRLALIDEAARLINEHGAASVSLQAVADRFSLTRASVYYYFKDRKALLGACFDASLDGLEQALEAGVQTNTGKNEIRAFMLAALAPDRCRSASLSELSLADVDLEASFQARLTSIVERLAKMIERGIKDQSLASHDPKITACLIFGIVAWTPIAPSWRGRRAYKAHHADAICDLVLNGISSHAGPEQFSTPSISTFEPRIGNLFDADELHRMKHLQLLQVASSLFNLRGIDGTSLDDVVTQLGATRGALYNYISDKTDLAIQCAERGFDYYERFASCADETTGSGAHKLLAGLRLNIEAQAVGIAPLAALIPLPGFPDAVAQTLQERARKLDRRFTVIIRSGMQDGSVSLQDPHTLQTAGTGAISWVPRLLEHMEHASPAEIAQTYVNVVARGLSAH